MHRQFPTPSQSWNRVRRSGLLWAIGDAPTMRRRSGLIASGWPRVSRSHLGRLERKQSLGLSWHCKLQTTRKHTRKHPHKQYSKTRYMRAPRQCFQLNPRAAQRKSFTVVSHTRHHWAALGYRRCTPDVSPPIKLACWYCKTQHVAKVCADGCPTCSPYSPWPPSPPSEGKDAARPELDRNMKEKGVQKTTE